MLRRLAVLLLVGLSLPAVAQYNMRKLMEEGRRTLDLGYYVAAMQIFSRVVSLKPGVYEAWYLDGLCKYHLEDYTGAEQSCTRALELNPYIADIYDLRAMSRMAIEKYDSAAIDYTSALDIDADNRDYWFNRAYCFYMCGNPTVARTQLDYIFRRWGSFAEARELRHALDTGRKPVRRGVSSRLADRFKMSSLSQGGWLMQRFPEEKEAEEQAKPKFQLGK